jgi:carbon monoxide dehydrogenase subunit G
MKVNGTATIAHPVGEVYRALTDPAVLVRTLPGCQRLEQTGPDRYQATLEAGVGSNKGLFDGNVRLSEMTAPDSFTLHASGTGAPGTVDAIAHVRLVADAAVGGTLVHYAADATVGGMIGGVGQRMLAGVARRTAGEFFAAVDRELTAGGVEPAPLVSEAVVAEAPGAQPAVVQASGPQPVVAAAESAPRVWTRPAPARDPDRQRIRDITLAAAFGAAIALLGVLLGAIVAGW